MNSTILHGITWDHPRGYEPLHASSLLYEKLFGLKVEWQKRSLAKFGDQSLTQLASRFDLIIMDHPHVGVAAKAGCLIPFDELLPHEQLNELEEQTAGPSFASYNYQGKQWALPIDAAMQSASYRPDLLDELPIPNNWVDVFELVASLQKKNKRVGMALCPTDCLCTFLTLTAQHGSPIAEGNERLVTPEAGMLALEHMQRMRDNFHPASLGWNPIQLYDHMSTRDDIAYAPLAFCYTNYSRDGFRKNLLCYSNVPGTKNAVLGGAGIAVSSTCNYLNEAAQYAAWICSAGIQNTIYVREQGQPANKLAWESDFANGLTHNFFINTRDTLSNAFVRPRYSGWPAFQTYLGEALHAYLKNGGNVIKVLDHLQEVYEQSLLPEK